MKALLPLVLALAAPLPAQRLITTRDGSTAVRIVDVSAGAILESFTIDLTDVQPPPGIASGGAAIRVGDEIWVAAGYYVYRFDAVYEAPGPGVLLGFLGPFPKPPDGLTEFAGSVWIAALTELHEAATDGSLLGSYPTTRSVHGLLAWHGKLLASAGSSIDEYDAGGQFVGTFSQDILLMDRGQLADSPSTGNLLATGATRIYELDPAGHVVGDWSPGTYEQGVQELADGRLLVNLISDTVVLDRASGETWTILSGLHLRGLAPFGPAGGNTGRHCQANPNSTGAPARISAFGRLSLLGNDLILDVTSLPPGCFGLFFYGSDETRIPWGDGFLCTGPSDLHRIQPAFFSSADGFLSRRVIYSDLPAGGAILPGSTWSFQLVYRDPAAGGTGLNSTDAVRLTFEP